MTAGAGRPPHALVTGGAGFIGSHLVDRLLRDGWEVSVIDNFDPFYDPQIKRRQVGVHASHPRFHLVEADIRIGPAALKERLAGNFDVIVHLAALAGVRPSLERPGEYLSVNVLGTQHLLDLARELGVRQFVYASSSSVYGTCPNVPWREEESDLRPISPYAASKLSGEHLGQVYAHLYGIRFLALRFFTVFGPRQRPDLAIHKFARRIAQGETIEIYGAGDSRRDYTFVDEIVSGVVAAMTYDQADFAVFNLGNNVTVGLTQMIAALEEALGRRAQVRHLPEQSGDVPQTWAEISRSQRQLGYAPQTPFAEGIQEFVRWLREEQGEAVPGGVGR